MTSCTPGRCRIGVVITLLCAAVPAAAFAQSRGERRIEVGAAIGAINLIEAVHEKPFAISVRAGYRLMPALGFEVDVTKCPQDPSNNFGELVIVAGPKAGVRLGRLDVLARLRAGAIRFDNAAFVAHNGRARTEPAIDAGATFELNTTRHGALRIDFGQMIVPFGSTPLRGPLPPYSRALGTTINPHGSIGWQFRF